MPRNASCKRVMRCAIASKRCQRLMWREITPAQQTFFSRQSALVLGAMDSRGRPWATVVAGAPGFIVTLKGHTLSNVCSASRRRPSSREPEQQGSRGRSWHRLRHTEAPSLQRSRFRSRSCAPRAGGGDRPQLSQLREIHPAPIHSSGEHGPRLAPPGRAACIRSACPGIGGERISTAFVASASPEVAPYAARGVDVSHRSGAQGFITVTGERSLQVPDDSGQPHVQHAGQHSELPLGGTAHSGSGLWRRFAR